MTKIGFNVPQTLLKLVLESKVTKTKEEYKIGVVEKLQAEVETLKHKVKALENGDISNEVITTLEEWKPEPTRSEIVTRAKEDVQKLTARVVNGLSKSGGNYTYNYQTAKPEFIVNKEKRTVVALVRGKYTKLVLEKGIAKCDPDDCFNSHIGRAIALRRALGLEVPEHYMIVPAPTEVGVGDIVRGRNTGLKAKVDNLNDESGLYIRGVYEDGGTLKTTHECVYIIDDSRE